MNKTEVGKQRIGNRMQSIECFRLIFSIIVIIAHCLTTDKFGIMMNGLGYVTVPFFFVVSGYFSYRTREKSMRKRFWSVLKLTIAANLLYLLWDAYLKGIRDVGSLLEWSLDKFGSQTLMIALLLNKSPIKSHLWYLSAIVICYAVMWLYVRWAEDEACNYKPLYIISVCLYALHVVLSSFATACEFDVPYYIYRNALLYGLPMFSLGIFLREYYDKIVRAYQLTKTKLIGLFAVGFCLSILQIRGTGKVEMPVGALLEIIALVLLLIMVPTVSGNSAVISGIISTFGTLSTYIYVTHMVWLDVYNMYVKEYVLRLGEEAETLLYPVVAIVISLATGILYIGIKSAMKSLSGKIKLAGKANKS